MNLCIYNTLTRTKQEFAPIVKGQVKMYVCGPTVYDFSHLGHGRAYTVFDVICRYLRYKGYKVTYVRNITDVDDKIIARASQIDMPGAGMEERISRLTSTYIDEFHKDMETLGLLRPDYEPRATDYIKGMISLTEKLIKNGLAYEIDGDVYFEVSRFKDYGSLSGRDIEQLLAGARVEPDPKKRAPLDFSLWKKAKPGEPSWESPWGMGRPGWHIECSCMSLALLGEEFDIHGGGQDLIFPHHENEIAQTYGVTKKQPVRYWIHNGFVTINREKMSKSLGNFFTLREIFAKYKPEVVKFFLLRQHYRSPIDFSDQLLSDAKNALERIGECLRKMLNYTKDRYDQKVYNLSIEKFHEAMDDDFNTAQALAVIFDLVKDINNDMADNLVDEKTIAKLKVLEKTLGILGIKYTLAETCSISKNDAEELNRGILQKILSEELSELNVARLLCHRNYCRKNKQWDAADRIRKHIEESGYILQDTNEGTKWIKK